MPRSSAFLYLLPVALLVGLWAFTSAGLKDKVSGTAAAADVTESQSETLAVRRENRRIFRLLMEPMLVELGQGSMTLRNASEKLVDFASQYHVEYLAHVHTTEEGATPVENMARNCLRHLREATKDEEDLAPAIPALEVQLAAIIAEESQKGGE